MTRMCIVLHWISFSWYTLEMHLGCMHSPALEISQQCWHSLTLFIGAFLLSLWYPSVSNVVSVEFITMFFFSVCLLVHLHWGYFSIFCCYLDVFRTSSSISLIQSAVGLSLLVRRCNEFFISLTKLFSCDICLYFSQFYS